MLENILTNKNVKTKTKITIKSLVSVALIALAVILPQIVHLAFGAEGGIKWLPMYLPVLIGGCLLGSWWGLGVGVASPVVSYLLTSALSSPMPALARLPFMIAELAVFALVSGAFSKLIAKNFAFSFPAVILAMLAGRITFVGLVAIFQNVSSLGVGMVLAQIKTGLAGIILQAIVVPIIIIALHKLLIKDNK